MHSSEITIQVDVGTAIKRLREEKLGLTQEDFSALLKGKGYTKCRERYIQRWEGEGIVPGGSVLIMILALCPDAESLSWFGVDLANLKGQIVKEEKRGIHIEPMDIRIPGRGKR